MKQLYSLAIGLCFIFTSVAQQTNRTVTVSGVTRNYIQYLPVGFDPQTEQLPVVIILHGLGGTNAQMVSAGFNNIADTARVIALYPQAKNNAYNQSAWNNGTLLGSTAADINFMHQLIDSAILTYNADPTRIYATGFSMGSIMSHHMACVMNNRIAAIGAMSGTMPTSDIQSCVPSYATPVIHLHGTADGTVPYDGTALPSLSLVPQTIAFWQNVHGCSASADSLRYSDLAADNITVDRFRYDNCNPTASLELWRFNGADHQFLYRPLNDINEMMEVWLFLRKWQHSNPATAGIQNATSIQLNAFPNPTEGAITITSSHATSFVVTDVMGHTIQNGSLSQGSTNIDLSLFPSGIYFLNAGSHSLKLFKY
jgi:polyhydroxybutyrate depolymerase